MSRPSQDAARQLRAELSADGPDPARFRAAFDRIPEADREVWLDALWDCEELPEDEPELPPGGVPYLPCPLATLLEAIEAAAIGPDDVFVDIGAGLGRTAALVHLCTGAGSIGLEIQPGLVRGARARAEWLRLERLRFLHGDALELVAHINVASVFFMYSPFGRSRLEPVLEHLRALARTREIRLCCVNMRSLERDWLTAIASPSPELVVYRSCIHRTAERPDAPR